MEEAVAAAEEATLGDATVAVVMMVSVTVVATVPATVAIGSVGDDMMFGADWDRRSGHGTRRGSGDMGQDREVAK